MSTVRWLLYDVECTYLNNPMTQRPNGPITNSPQSFFRRTGGLDGSRDNSAKFAVFGDNRDNSFRRKQGTLSDDFKPDGRFIELFENDFEFMNEVGPAFRAPRFPIIGGGRGSGSQNLTANMTALRRSWQF